MLVHDVMRDPAEMWVCRSLMSDNVCSRSAHNYSVISQTAVPAYDVMSVVSNALAMLGQIPSNDSLRL